MKRIILAATLACAATAVSAEEDTHSAYHWIKMCESPLDSVERTTCIFYIYGIVDTMGFQFGAYCPPATARMGQLREIALTKIKSEPERWHQPMAQLTVQALKEAFPCPALPPELTK